MLVNHLFSGRTPKDSESITDCQDYFEINEARGCFAIADGASQSFYPAIWAKLLVQHFCENPEISELNWRTWLEPIQTQWFTEVRSRVETAKSQGKPTWIEGYNGLSMHRSATSTFIGLRFNENKIKACIVGDSCLFILKDRNLESYPLKHSEDFNDRPEYLASYSKDNHFQPHFFDINFEQSDNAYVILATDALSKYILKCSEQRKDIFSHLLSISSQQQFENFVASARHQTIGMTNDDVTLLVLSYSSSFRQNISQAPINPVAPGSSIASSDHSRSQIPQITGLIEDSNRSNPVKTWLSTITNKLSGFPTASQDIEKAIPNSSQNSLKIINHLKQQRAILFAVVVILTPLFFWIGRVTNNTNQPTTQMITSSNINPRSIQIPLGERIYTDQELTQLLITSLSNSSEVLVLEEGDRWIKFQVELYAYNTIINSCPSCSSNEIEILPAKNLRVFPSGSDIDIFGQLNRNEKFQKSQFNSLPDWHKFRFVGYIAK
jgi:serine/threonine protein phosphatase PrpC